MTYFYSTNLVFGGVALGIIAHELFHILTMSQVSTITYRFGTLLMPNQNFISVCCLIGMETAMENIAYLVQGLVTATWILVGVRG